MPPYLVGCVASLRYRAACQSRGCLHQACAGGVAVVDGVGLLRTMTEALSTITRASRRVWSST